MHTLAALWQTHLFLASSAVAALPHFLPSDCPPRWRWPAYSKALGGKKRSPLAESTQEYLDGVSQNSNCGFPSSSRPGFKPNFVPGKREAVAVQLYTACTVPFWECLRQKQGKTGRGKTVSKGKSRQLPSETEYDVTRYLMMPPESDGEIPQMKEYLQGSSGLKTSLNLYRESRNLLQPLSNI